MGVDNQSQARPLGKYGAKRPKGSSEVQEIRRLPRKGLQGFGRRNSADFSLRAAIWCRERSSARMMVGGQAFHPAQRIFLPARWITITAQGQSDALGILRKWSSMQAPLAGS